jgi:hypothetical protein
MRRIHLHLDADLDDELAREARARGVSKSALIRETLRRCLPLVAVDDPSARLIGAYKGSPNESSSVSAVIFE